MYIHVCTCVFVMHQDLFFLPYRRFCLYSAELPLTTTDITCCHILPSSTLRSAEGERARGEGWKQIEVCLTLPCLSAPPGERKQLNVLNVDKVALPSYVIGIMHYWSRYETVCYNYIYFAAVWVEIPACCLALDCYIWRCWFQLGCVCFLLPSPPSPHNPPQLRPCSLATPQPASSPPWWR